MQSGGSACVTSATALRGGAIGEAFSPIMVARTEAWGRSPSSVGIGSLRGGLARPASLL